MNTDKLMSVLMLIVISIGTLAILAMPSRLNLQEPVYEQDDGPQIDSKNRTVIHVDQQVQIVSLPFNKKIGISIGQTVVFETKLTLGMNVSGSIVVEGSDCVVFYIMDEPTYLQFLLNKVPFYATTNLIHTKNFELKADKSTNYFIVIQNNPKSCHDKLITLNLYEES